MKKELFMITALSIAAISMTGCGSQGANAPTAEEKVETTQTAEKATTTEAPVTDTVESNTGVVQPKQVVAPYEVDLQAGKYYIGLHIPEGVYSVSVNSGLGNIMTNSGVNSAMGSGTAVTYADSFDNLTLANGDVLTVTQSLNINISTKEAYYSSMVPYENPAGEEKELSAGNYIVGQDVAPGIYDISIVEGTANVNLDDYSFSAMLTNESGLSESVTSTFKNLELLEGRTLVVGSGTVKITPTPDIEPLIP